MIESLQVNCLFVWEMHVNKKEVRRNTRARALSRARARTHHTLLLQVGGYAKHAFTYLPSTADKCSTADLESMVFRHATFSQSRLSSCHKYGTAINGRIVTPAASSKQKKQ
jgi:hypothetical protein